ncbi:MAG: hypothetical protein K0R38_5209 [Polyangiaceae bacterium]|jgi:uncharacterized protein YecE (DUF72 family)|nr:hypothetical protein [Polyangiaceae bacterium]
MRPQSYRAWRAAVPEDFQFAVKGGRFITHMKRLKGAETALANFFASGLLCLGPKLGPILWQLPPTLRFDADVLRAFFDLLPRSGREMEKLARKHDARLAGRSQLEAEGDIPPLRHALEVRHPSFQDARYVDILREHGVASCVADSAGLYPVIDVATTNFAYARLHGASELYVSGYSNAELRAWAARVRTWQRRREVFVFFDNDVKVRAPFDALNLTRILEGKRPQALPQAQATVTERARTVWPAWQTR